MMLPGQSRHNHQDTKPVRVSHPLRGHLIKGAHKRGRLITSDPMRGSRIRGGCIRDELLRGHIKICLGLFTDLVIA